ncbi:ABC transporter substrate-binding protein [Modestobacter sp. VKM Ac-2979]|uniref:ABC transporter substrate-binding protein n=1 Tax=unclassified Modestobacter TaxID=2643866 RepID=UPI0022AB734C|nr:MULTISPECIES: ABC transporter substrate-binding protein [unclassified Modestobacter]MCZ2814159.1 ABC transporter substrate-binding protein [Modestobacter sp. VKM Ac-2979]MCZ2844425.1 ABC transporter substrate-binding protein [Modestobacter sp. VKM Ac-2980]
MNRSRTRNPLALRRPTLMRAGVAVLATGALTSLAACGGGGEGGGGTSSQSPSDTLTFAYDADAAPTGYDPLEYSQGQFTFFSTLYDSLFVTQPDGTVAPSLVTEFSNNEDDTQTTLTLRDGVTFADGSELTAEVVKANLDRRNDADLEAYGALASGGASEIVDVAAPDPQTVVITWAQPQASPENNLTDTAGVVVGPDGLADPASLETTPDGSGAYTLNAGETTRASTYTLDKNDEAWNADEWAYDSVVFNVITDSQALANAVISGQADIATILKPTTIDMVEQRSSLAKVGGTIVGFPVIDKTGATNPAFADERVRQAISHAIDREAIVEQLHPGAQPTAQLFPAEAEGFDPTLNEEFGYDPERARELLAEAGLPDGFAFDITVLGQPSEDQVVIQQQLAEVGITMNFVTATSTDQVFAAVRTDPLIFGPMAIGGQPAGWVAGVLYGGFMNMQGATEPEIQSALGAALGATGDAREQALGDLNRAIAENGWYIPVYEDYAYTGYNAEKVAEPSYAGTNNYLVLSEVEPAA